eukprot:scaffold114190_cov46-Prasinocladus_malaysianus.AAC.1
MLLVDTHITVSIINCQYPLDFATHVIWHTFSQGLPSGDNDGMTRWSCMVNVDAFTISCCITQTSDLARRHACWRQHVESCKLEWDILCQLVVIIYQFYRWIRTQVPALAYVLGCVFLVGHQAVASPPGDVGGGALEPL